MVRDCPTLERQLGIYKGLVEVSGLINEITEHDALLPEILAVARRVLEVEAASLFLVNPAGELELAVAQGGPPLEGGRVIVPRGRGVCGWVLENARPLLVPDAYADHRFFPDIDRKTGFRTRSILCVPLVRNGKQIGVLQGMNPLERDAFDEADLEAFTAYGNLAATAIDKVRTLEGQRLQDRREQEFSFAREIQASFLPRELPARKDLHFAAAYRPALNVGGDFYDVIESGEDEIYFVVGDVSGKGMPAALLMAQALSGLRLIIEPGISPTTAMARWNKMLIGHAIRGMFITALLGRIRPSLGRVELANAGHCLPLRTRRGETAVEEIALPGSPPLGLLPELLPETYPLSFKEHEWLVFFTDGLVESFDPADRPLGRDSVIQLLRSNFPTASAVVTALTDGEAAHRREAPPHDDLTVLVFGSA